MEGASYGAGRAGGDFDFVAFIKQPQTILRIISWIFSIVVFASIVNEGYLNENGSELYCIYNKNNNACNYGIVIGTVAFFACLFFFIVDIYFPQISSIKDRKRAVLVDLSFSGIWTLLWFVGFCFLANQWQQTNPGDSHVPQGADGARAAIAFSFFSIISWGYLTLVTLDKFKHAAFVEDSQRLLPSPSMPSQA
nr:PREDICTED: synaptogyrin-3 isoform X2 [Latimeria chalumnae]|eukprot:XP_014350483.1 PREDICTED: synaptogyrin-3 isoform X2 [Latimeria chalumnae]